MVSKREKARLEAVIKRNDLAGFLSEFHNESDRATAILGAAYLDEQLLELITDFLIDDKDEVRELLATEKPLGSFGARIRAAYCMGLLSSEDSQDLKIIKAIRNDFAHQLHGLSFDEESIADKCKKIRAPKRVLTGSLNCSHCWEVNHKTVHLHFGLHMMHKNCPACKTVYEPTYTNSIAPV